MGPGFQLFCYRPRSGILKLYVNSVFDFWGEPYTVFLVAQLVKNPPAMQETQVQSLGGEDSPGEGNGNPFQYSYLENPHGQRSLAS